MSSEKDPAAIKAVDVGSVVQAHSHTGAGDADAGALRTRDYGDRWVAAVVDGNLTLGEYGERWLKRRELEGHRSAATDSSRWAAHVARSEFGLLPIERVRRRHVRVWLSELMTKPRQWGGFSPNEPEVAARRSQKPLAMQTVRNALNLLRCCLTAAVDDEVIEMNPARDVRVPRQRGATSDELWTVLTLAEQAALLSKVPIPERWIVAAALGTGLRQGELYALHLCDVHLDDPEPYIFVRYGGRKALKKGGTWLPTKNGKPRRVPLFGLGLEAFERWVGRGDMWRFVKGGNPLGLVFPSRYSRHRPKGAPKKWNEWLESAGITRSVRWHDLRHSCASSLVGGWWGRSWSLEEVCQLLGHSKIEVTERYAHFGHDVLQNAASDSDNVLRFPGPKKDDEPPTGGGGGGGSSSGTMRIAGSVISSESSGFGAAADKNTGKGEQMDMRCGWDLNPRMPVLQSGNGGVRVSRISEHRRFHARESGRWADAHDAAGGGCVLIGGGWHPTSVRVLLEELCFSIARRLGFRRGVGNRNGGAS